MKPSIKVLGIVAAMAVGVTAFAQQPAAPASASAGLLGKRYVQAGYGLLDINHSSVDAFGAGLDINVPLTANLDLGVGYVHSWVESFSDIDSDAAAADLTAYFAQGNLRPFASVSLGYLWDDSDDRAIWGANVGVEYDFSPVLSGALSGGYTDDFESGSNDQWEATASANYWLRRNLAANAAVSLIERGHVGYTLGVTLRF